LIKVFFRPRATSIGSIFAAGSGGSAPVSTFFRESKNREKEDITASLIQGPIRA
jgi:hypothetical protein